VEWTTSLLLGLKGSIALLIFAVGLGSSLKDLDYLVSRPSLLLRSLLAMYVVVPLAALAAVRFLPLPPALALALLVLAISAGAPLLPRKLMKLGNEEYVLGLVVISSLLAILTVPAWLVLLGPYLDRSGTLQPIAVARVIGASFLVPLLLGVAARWFLPNDGARLSDAILRIVGLIFTICGLGLLGIHWQVIRAAMGLPILTLCGFTIVALGIGHLLGGPDPADRSALAISCATRHVGVAMVVAAVTPDPRTAVLIVAYMLASALVIIPYMKWRGRVGLVRLQRQE